MRLPGYRFINHCARRCGKRSKIGIAGREILLFRGDTVIDFHSDGSSCNATVAADLSILVRAFLGLRVLVPALVA